MSKRTNHNSAKKILYDMANRCVKCGMKIPKGDTHYIDGKACCGRCAYERKVK